MPSQCAIFRFPSIVNKNVMEPQFILVYEKACSSSKMQIRWRPKFDGIDELKTLNIQVSLENDG